MAHDRTPRFPATVVAMFLFDDDGRDGTMILAESTASKLMPEDTTRLAGGPRLPAELTLQ